MYRVSRADAAIHIHVFLSRNKVGWKKRVSGGTGLYDLGILFYFVHQTHTLSVELVDNKQLSAIILTKSVTRPREWRRVCVTALPQDQSLSNSRSWQETRSPMGTHLECKNVQCACACACVWVCVSVFKWMLSLQVGAPGRWSVTPGPGTGSDTGGELTLSASIKHQTHTHEHTHTHTHTHSHRGGKKYTDFHSANVTEKCLEMFIHHKHWIKVGFVLQYTTYTE